MVTKKRSGSERVKAGIGAYLASEGANVKQCQSAFASHPEGMVLPAHRVVETLARRARYALRASPRAASGRSHVTALAGRDFEP
jgi:hypothetical protein